MADDPLGLRFEGEEGDHFFKSTLVQTHLWFWIFPALGLHRDLQSRGRRESGPQRKSWKCFLPFPRHRALP